MNKPQLSQQELNRLDSKFRDLRLLAVILIGVIASFVVLLAVFWSPSKASLNFASYTGPLGDTIGGIAGPILNLTGLVVVYFSFREQLRANQIQMDALSKEIRQRNTDETLKVIERATQHLVKDLSDLASFFSGINAAVSNINYIREDPEQEERDAWTAEANGDYAPRFKDYRARLASYDRIREFLKSRLDFLLDRISVARVGKMQRAFLYDNVRHTYLAVLREMVDMRKLGAIAAEYPEEVGTIPLVQELLRQHNHPKLRIKIDILAQR